MTHSKSINTPLIIQHLINLKKHNPTISNETLRTTNYVLTRLDKHANLKEPEQVTLYIANLPRTNNYKYKLTQNYAKFLEYINLPYKRPYYPKDAKPIRIPTREKLEMLISNAGRVMSVKLQLSLETGLRPIELMNLKVKDIDLEQRLVYPTTAKNGNPRTLKITNQLTTTLQKHIIKNSLNQNDKLFKGDATHYGKEYRETRNYLAKKLNDPTIRTIRLYDFRHYFATMLYHKTRDILLVKQQMGHKQINTTLIYTQLLNLNDDEWTCKASTNVEQSKQLIEAGFEYVTEQDGIKLYRKRK